MYKYLLQFCYANARHVGTEIDDEICARGAVASGRDSTYIQGNHKYILIIHYIYITHRGEINVQ